MKPDNTADRRNIELAYDDGTTAVIGKGVDEGEQVIVSGQTRVGQGAKLSPQEQSRSAQR